MPALSIEGLHRRVRLAPVVHLGERSTRTLGAYECGYDAGVEHHGGGPLIDELGDYFREFIGAQVAFTDEHNSRLNAWTCFSPRSYALLQSADEAESLDRYLDLRAEALAAYRAAGGKPGAVQRWSGKASLLELIMTMRKRPGMYFGTAHVGNFWAFASGFRWAEHDLGQASIDVARLQKFQVWMDERYPFGRGGSWARTIRFLAMAQPDRECPMFYEHLDVFLGGAGPDAPDPGMEKMLANIVAHASKLKRDDG